MNRLADLIYDIKDDISDKEYLKIMNEIGRIYDLHFDYDDIMCDRCGIVHDSNDPYHDDSYSRYSNETNEDDEDDKEYWDAYWDSLIE
jgi:hypothetical protein